MEHPTNLRKILIGSYA